MCIFATPVNSVSGTNILAAHVTVLNKCYGLIVYQNTVDFPILSSGKRNGTMILPVPNTNRTGVRVVRLEDEKETSKKDEEKLCYNLFSSLDAMFTKPVDRAFGGDLSFSLDTLPVFRTGSWEHSFVPDLRSFPRLHSRFQTDAKLIGFLSRSYPTGFGFLVCDFKGTGTRMLPLAYLSELQPDGTVFIPTKHYHPPASDAAKPSVDWDHSIFCASASLCYSVGESKTIPVRSSTAYIKSVLGIDLEDTYMTRVKIDSSFRGNVDLSCRPSTVHRVCDVCGNAVNAGIELSRWVCKEPTCADICSRCVDTRAEHPHALTKAALHKSLKMAPERVVWNRFGPKTKFVPNDGELSYLIYQMGDYCYNHNMMEGLLSDPACGPRASEEYRHTAIELATASEQNGVSTTKFAKAMAMLRIAVGTG